MAKRIKKNVVSAKSACTPKFRYGRVNGSKYYYDCKLECGHDAQVSTRDSKGEWRSESAVKTAVCKTCSREAERLEEVKADQAITEALAFLFEDDE